MKKKNNTPMEMKMMVVELKENVFSKMSHDQEQNHEINIRRNHIPRGS